MEDFVIAFFVNLRDFHCVISLYFFIVEAGEVGREDAVGKFFG